MFPTCLGLSPSPSMVLLGALLTRSYDGDVHAAQGLKSLDEFRPTRKHLLPKAVTPKYRLQRFKSEVLPVMLWGAAAWHMHESRLGAALSAIVRMVRIMLYDVRPSTETCVEWHGRSWRQAKAQLLEAWRDHPAVLLAARAVGGVLRCDARTASSVMGRTLRWRSSVDVGQKRGRPRGRWEMPWVELADTHWWNDTEGWSR